jgi:cytochrome c biogenesis protein CcdA
MVATVVDWEALADVVVASFVAAVGVTIMFSLAIYGATRLADMRREEHRRIEVVAFGLLSAVGLAATAGAVVLGLIVMLSK